MNRQMLSHYGWIIIITLVITVMIAFATPFGDYVGEGLLYVSGGFVDVSDEALSDENMANKEQKWEEKISTMQNPGVHNGTIFQSGEYTIKSTGKVLKGDNKDLFPATPAPGDKYEYGDYEYRYNYCYYSGSGWYQNSAQHGWGVKAKDRTKTAYGEILTEIAGQKITNMRGAFWGCINFTTAPTIPNSVTDMHYTFYWCTSLTTAPAIPDSVTDMYETFYNCTSLTTAPIIPSSVTNIRGTFSGCTSLTTAPIIPSSVTNIRDAFSGCTSLTGTIEINANPTHYSDCFYNTTQQIILTGTSSKLNDIASQYSNVTVASTP